MGLFPFLFARSLGFACKNGTELYLYANKTATYRNGTTQPQLICREPKHLCDKYPQLYVNCTYVNDNGPFDYWECASQMLPSRYIVEGVDMQCEEEKTMGKLYYFYDNSCRVSVLLNPDGMGAFIYRSTWRYVIELFGIGVLALFLLLILVWIFPDFSLVDENFKKRKIN